MPKQRMNIYLAREWMDALDVLAAQRRVSKSAIIEAAVASMLTPDSADTREAAFVRRLDSMTRKLEKLDRDLAISSEAFALFMRFWLNVTPPPSDALQSAAKISADERFAGFIEVLGRRMAKGPELCPRHFSRYCRSSRMARGRQPRWRHGQHRSWCLSREGFGSG